VTIQRQLWGPCATVRTVQHGLFDGQPVYVGLSCEECGAELVETECGYGCCPRGCGKLLLLVSDPEPCGSWFGEELADGKN
jgi:hypothetical protein